MRKQFIVGQQVKTPTGEIGTIDQLYRCNKYVVRFGFSWFGVFSANELTRLH